MRILQLIAMFRSLMGMIGIPLDQLLALIQKVMSIGVPPNVKDEAAFRAWLTKFAAVALEITTITPIVLDDAFAKFLAASVASDASWKTFYGILTMFFHDDGVFKETPPTDTELFAASSELCTQIDGASFGLSPALILALFKLITDIINAWRK